MFTPFPFSPINDAMLLKAAGYRHEFYPADWEDIGGAESGPKLYGHPDMDVWSAPAGDGWDHVIVVVDGMVVECQNEPSGPPGWEDQF